MSCILKFKLVHELRPGLSNIPTQPKKYEFFSMNEFHSYEFCTNYIHDKNDESLIGKWEGRQRKERRNAFVLPKEYCNITRIKLLSLLINTDKYETEK